MIQRREKDKLRGGMFEEMKYDKAGAEERTEGEGVMTKFVQRILFHNGFYFHKIHINRSY